MNKHTLLSLVGSIALAFLIGCGGGGGQPVTPPPPPMVTSVAVSPSTATLPVGQTQQFTANVQGTGSFNPAVNWEVNNALAGNSTVGTISTSGLYMAPTLVPSPSTVTVRAVSIQDSTKFATASARVTVKVGVSPSPIQVPTQAHQAFLAKVEGSSNLAVNWSVNDVAGGNATLGTVKDLGLLPPFDIGLYEAPNTLPTPTTVIVKAAAQADLGQFATASVNLSVPQNRSRQSPPVALGTSGGNVKDSTGLSCASGTLGSLVTRGGSFFILSNNHVLALSNSGIAGDPISQPGLIDANCLLSNVQVAANLSQFANVKTANVDAAMAQIQAGAVNTTGAILGLGTTSASSAPPANSVVSAAVGMPVAKSGRTTGLACAHVLATNATIQVNYEPLLGMPFAVTFTNQIMVVDDQNVPGFLDHGDSGSLLVNSQTAQPVGLLFAGGDVTAIANPIQDALNALKNTTTGAVPTVVGGAQHEIACPTPSPAPGFTSATQALTAKPELSAASAARAKAAKDRHEKELMADPAVIGVGIAASQDRPGEAAILVFVERGKLHGAIPSEIEGVQVVVRETSPFQALQKKRVRKAKKR